MSVCPIRDCGRQAALGSILCPIHRAEYEGEVFRQYRPMDCINVSLSGLGELIKEVEHLRKQVTYLQENSTKIVEENRRLRIYYGIPNAP